jgi:hypothetical protein
MALLSGEVGWHGRWSGRCHSCASIAAAQRLSAACGGLRRRGVLAMQKCTMRWLMQSLRVSVRELGCGAAPAIAIERACLRRACLGGT